ncbi:MAG: hypothetical protein ACTIBG_05980 [Brevibacterium aurantiacum]|uniref:hypothetical protein n=1 Tax=Brevibacterium aurantiacum TaxID=273384 RepID=UPI003F8F28CF
MSDVIKCNTCGRENLDNDSNWMMDRKRGRIKTAKCPSCLTFDEFANAAYEAEAHGFIYDPKTDRTYARPRDPSLPRTTLRCPCGFMVSDSGDDVQDTIDEHREGCPEGGGDHE